MNDPRIPALYTPLKAVSFITLALMAGAIAYAAWITISNWTGISV